MQLPPIFFLALIPALTACRSSQAPEAPDPAAAPPQVSEPATESMAGPAPPTESPAEDLATGDPAPAPDPLAVAAPDAPVREPAKPGLETLHFEIEIAAPVETVWGTMFAPDSYTEWTAPFQEGSYFEGTWTEGERMHFLAPNGSGVVAEIAVNRPHEVVSIKHLGYVVAGKEITDTEGIRTWAPAYEIYRFASTPTGTRVSVEHDNLASMVGYMNTVWPQALTALKELCEQG